MSNWSHKDKGLNGIEGIGPIEETNLEDVNFIWTQVKRQHIVEGFDSQIKRVDTDLKQSKYMQLIKRNGSESKLAPGADNTDSKKEGLLLRVYGKLENGFHLSNKKALFMNMKLYYEALN